MSNRFLFSPMIISGVTYRDNNKKKIIFGKGLHISFAELKFWSPQVKSSVDSLSNLQSSLFLSFCKTNKFNFPYLFLGAEEKPLIKH